MTLNYSRKLLYTFILSLLIVPTLTYAHQPRVTESETTKIVDPEISKVYYGQLKGNSHSYFIESEQPFNLYVNILTPDIKSQKNDVSARIYKNETEIVYLNGLDHNWTRFYEPFGADKYWSGPEFDTNAESGNYEIIITSTNNDSKYALAVGKIESFNTKEVINTLKIIPKIKHLFFEKSAIGFIASPFGILYVFLLYSASALFGLTYRTFLKKVAHGTVRGVSRNIGRTDRLFRLLIGLGLLFWTLHTSWNPILLFLSGFAFFEAVFKWCGLYALLGKNTCPLE